MTAVVIKHIILHRFYHNIPSYCHRVYHQQEESIHMFVSWTNNMAIHSTPLYNQPLLYPALGKYNFDIHSDIQISFKLIHAIFLLSRGAKVRKRAKIRNRYTQAPRLTQDTNGKVTTSQLDITNESQEVSPFPKV